MITYKHLKKCIDDYKEYYKEYYFGNGNIKIFILEDLIRDYPNKDIDTYISNFLKDNPEYMDDFI
jgi:hypothetical protein